MTISYPNPLPFKLRVLKALTDCLKEITPANGYVCNMADFDPGDGVAQSRVFRGRPWFGENDPIPMLSILEGTNPADDVAEPTIDTTTGRYWWYLLVQGFVDDDHENPTDPAYLLMADVRRCLSLQRKRKAPGTHTVSPFGLSLDARSQIEELLVGPGVVRPADDISAKAHFWLSLEMQITENALLPYA